MNLGDIPGGPILDADEARAVTENTERDIADITPPTGPRVAAMTFEIDTPGANLTRSGDWLINRGNYYRWTGEPLTEGVFSTLSITPVGGFLVFANGTRITRTA